MRRLSDRAIAWHMGDSIDKRREILRLHPKELQRYCLLSADAVHWR